MRISLHRFWPVLFLGILLSLAFCGGRPAHAGTFTDGLVAALGGQALGWIVLPAAVAALLAVSWGATQVAAWARESSHASRVARLFDTLASQADGIVGTLLEHPPASGDVLRAVREAAIAQGIAYAKVNLPSTIATIGVSDATLAARLANDVRGTLQAMPASEARDRVIAALGAVPGPAEAAPAPAA